MKHFSEGVVSLIILITCHAYTIRKTFHNHACSTCCEKSLTADTLICHEKAMPSTNASSSAQGSSMEDGMKAM